MGKGEKELIVFALLLRPLGKDEKKEKKEGEKRKRNLVMLAYRLTL